MKKSGLSSRRRVLSVPVGRSGRLLSWRPEETHPLCLKSSYCHPNNKARDSCGSSESICGDSLFQRLRARQLEEPTAVSAGKARRHRSSNQGWPRPAGGGVTRGRAPTSKSHSAPRFTSHRHAKGAGGPRLCRGPGPSVASRAASQPPSPEPVLPALGVLRGVARLPRPEHPPGPSGAGPARGRSASVPPPARGRGWGGAGWRRRERAGGDRAAPRNNTALCGA